MNYTGETAGLYIPLDENGNQRVDGKMYLSCLGGGGFGKTYCAYSSKDRCLRGETPDGVVKVFFHEEGPEVQKLCRDSEYHRLVVARKNSQALRSLSPRPINVGEASIHPNKYPAFLMSYIPGVGLEEVLDEMACGNAPSSRERLAYATALAEPLRALHSAQARRQDGSLVELYAHGDVKPNNFVVQYAAFTNNEAAGEPWSKEVLPRGPYHSGLLNSCQIERCCLLDFGTLREASEVARPELTAVWELDVRQIGLHAVYSAPEKLNSDRVMLDSGETVLPGALSVTSKSDVWSYGILLLRMCHPDLYSSYKEGVCEFLTLGRGITADNLPSVKSAVEESAERTRGQLKDRESAFGRVQNPDRPYLSVVDALLALVIYACLQRSPSDRPSMAQLSDLYGDVWTRLKDGSLEKLGEDDLHQLVSQKLGFRNQERTSTPTFVSLASERTQDVPVMDARNAFPNRAAAPATEAAGALEDALDDSYAESTASASRPFRTIALSAAACVSAFAVPLTFWSVLSAGGATHVDLIPLTIGLAAILVGAVAVVLSRGAAAVSAVVSLVLAGAACFLFPAEAMMLPAAIGSSNAQYHIAERLDSEGDTDSAFDYYAKSAEAGNPFANYALGEYYEFGSGPVEQDPDAASAYYKQAGDLGYSPK